MKAGKAILIIFCTPIYLLSKVIATILFYLLQIPLTPFWIAVFLKHKKKHKQLYED